MIYVMRYNSSERDCQLLALESWTNLHSSMQMKEMYLNMASKFQIPWHEGFSWEEIANGVDKQNFCSIKDVGSCKIVHQRRWKQQNQKKPWKLRNQKKPHCRDEI